MYIRGSELKSNAKKTLKGGYWSCVLTSLVLGFAAGTSSIGGTYTYNMDAKGINPGSFNAYLERLGPADLLQRLDIPVYMIGTFLTLMLAAMVLAILLSIFLLQPLEVGCRRFFIEAGRGDYYFGYMGMAFSKDYLNVVKIMFLRWLYTFLWTLLFIIPGIVKSYEYRMVPYILAENPGMPAKEVFRRSRDIMDGDKMNSFWFDFSFIFWFCLSSITFGIAGVFFVDPYYNNACAGLYELLKTKVSRGVYPSGQQVIRPADIQYGYSDGKTVAAEDARPFDRPYGE